MILLLFACSTGGGSTDDLTSSSTTDDSESTLTCELFVQADGKTASGYEYCYADPYDLGAVNRTSAEACVGDPRATIPACHLGDKGYYCAKDTDCGAEQVCGM